MTSVDAKKKLTELGLLCSRINYFRTSLSTPVHSPLQTFSKQVQEKKLNAFDTLI